MTSRFYFAFSTPLNQLGQTKRQPCLREFATIAATHLDARPIDLNAIRLDLIDAAPASAIDRGHEVGNRCVVFSCLSP
jgi:hypothetical protein